ncbi:MAG: hypothetical protein WD424_09585 [Paenibacillaceae bacterium]
MRATLFLIAIVAYLCSAAYPSRFMDWVVSILCILVVIVVINSVKRFVQVLGTVFLVIGITLLVGYGAPWTKFVLGFGPMLNILSLFALITLLALPIELGQYAIRVQMMIRSKVNYPGILYSLTSFLSYILSSFMNLATLPMIYHLIRPSLDSYPIEHKERFMSRAITHGHSLTAVWTPAAPIVGIIIEMTGVRWSSIIVILIPFSLLGLLLDWSMGMWRTNRRQQRIGLAVIEEMSAAREESLGLVIENLKKVKSNHPIQIFVAILVFNGAIFVLEKNTDFSFLLLVSLTVIPFAFIWSIMLGKGKAFIVSARKVLPEHLLKMKDLFFVFLSAGFMISAIQSTEAGHVINEGILAVRNWVGTDVFLLLIPLIPLGLAFLGLHPAVGLALAAESLNPAALGISVELTAIAMLTGAVSAFMMGPYNATAGLMSTLVGESPYRVSKWNAPFTIAYLIMVMVLLTILNMG